MIAEFFRTVGFVQFFGWALGISAVLIIIAICIDASSVRKKTTQLKSIPGFDAVVAFGGDASSAGVALDPITNRFALVKTGKPPEIYNFDQLMAVEVLRNGGSIQKTNRGSQIAGAAVGGVLLGPAGLLLGGLTGSKRADDRVSRLSLKIFTDDLISPVTEVCFFQNPNGMSANGIPVRVAMNQLDEWHGRFQTILRKQEVLRNANANA